MPDPAELARLTALARRVRLSILELVYTSGSGHVGAALSQADILCALYGHYLRVDATRPDWPERDRFVLSKGHGGLGLVPLMVERGFLQSEELATFGETGARLGMHMDHRRVPGIEVSSGSLGHGLGVAAGIAMGLRLAGLPGRVVCLLSDGECYEGSTWEAALCASAQRLTRLVAVVDRNRMTMDGPTEAEVPLEPLADKWRAFGFRALTCDGHDFASLCSAFDQAFDGSAPTVVIAETIKGKAVDFMEGQPAWHYGSLDSAMYARAVASVSR